jgi:chaperonin GroEL
MKDLGIELDKVEISQLGQAKLVRVDGDNTTIIEGAGESKAIQGRIEQIRREIEITTSDYDREKLQERLPSSAGGVAQINVGAATEAELKEKKARIEDALHATRAAVEEGRRPGRGRRLHPRPQGLNGGRQLEARRRRGRGREDRPHGHHRPAQADRRERRHARQRRRPPGHGRQGQRGLQRPDREYVDMIKAGILTPTKVERTALQNAPRSRSCCLTTDCIVVEAPKKDEAATTTTTDPTAVMGGDG